MYSALRDCVTAISLDKQQCKAYYRLCRCLLLLDKITEAKRVFDTFTTRFPEQSQGYSYESLDYDVHDAVNKMLQKTSPPNSQYSTLSLSIKNVNSVSGE